MERGMENERKREMEREIQGDTDGVIGHQQVRDGKRQNVKGKC